jgi:hypothetical protein
VTLMRAVVGRCENSFPGASEHVLFSYASLAHRWRHSAEQYLAVAMTLRLIDCPQRRHVLASVNHHTPVEEGDPAGGVKSLPPTKQGNAEVSHATPVSGGWIGVLRGRTKNDDPCQRWSLGRPAEIG